MELYQTRIPPPMDWQQLQRITKEFYELRYPGCVVDEYGTNGQAQNGVDVYVYNQELAIGVQCKCVQKLSDIDLINEFDKTKKFKNKLSRYILVVTVSRDTKLVDLAAQLTIKSGILVEVVFWQSLVEDIVSHESLARKYFKFAVIKQVSFSTVHVELEAGDSYYNFVVTCMADFKSSRTNFSEDLLLVTSLASAKKSCFHRLGSGFWGDFIDVVGCSDFDAYVGWRWFQQFSTFKELMANSQGKQFFGLSKQEIEEFKRPRDEEE